MQEHSKKIQELSNFLLDYATTLMAVGSHTSRIVKNVTRIAESFGFGVDMTIFQRNITMTVKHSEDYSIRRTYVRRIPAMALNFRTISDLSALSWEAYDHHPGLHELQLRFNTIVNTPRMSRWMVLLLVACANAAFCRLFGGDPIAMGLDCHPGRLFYPSGTHQTSVEPYGHLYYLFLYRFPDCRTRSILQFRDHPRYRTRYQRPVSDSRSTADQFHPGYTRRSRPCRFIQNNQCHDINYLYRSRLIHDFINFRKRYIMNNEFWLPVLTDGLFAAIAAIGFAVISNPPKRAISVVALLGAFGHACRFYLLHYTPLNLTISSLFAAFGIGMLSMLAARLVRCPAEVFSFPALLPMIPGMYAYKTVLALIRFMKSDDVSQSQQLIVEIFRNGLTTLFVMFALVIGVSLAMFIFYKQSFTMTRLLPPHHKKQA